MTTVDDVNRCLTIQDSVDQLNCIRTQFGLPPIAATSPTTSSPTLTQYLILGGAVIVLLYLITKK